MNDHGAGAAAARRDRLRAGRPRRCVRGGSSGAAAPASPTRPPRGCRRPTRRPWRGRPPRPPRRRACRGRRRCGIRESSRWSRRASPCSTLLVGERLVLVGRVRLRDERVDRRARSRRRGRAAAPPRRRCRGGPLDSAHDVAHVLVGLGRQPDLQVELQPREAAREDEPRLLAEHLVGDLLVDVPPQPLVAGLGRDRERALALAREDLEDRVLDRVDLDGGKRDVVPELGEALEDRDDLAGGRRRPSRSGPCGPSAAAPRARPSRIDAAGYCLIGRHRVGRPAEPAHLGAAARDLDQELVGELGAGRQDRRVRDLEVGRDLLARHRLLDDDLRVLGRLGARARGPPGRRSPGARRAAARKPSRSRPAGEELRDAAGRDARRRPARRRRRRATSAAGFIRAMSPPTRSERVPLVALLAPQRDPAPSDSVRRMLTMSISHESDHASRPNSESGVPVSKVDGGLALLVEEPLADEVRHPVEEPVHPLEAEVRHPDLVGVRKAERDPVGAEAVRLLREPLERGKVPVRWSASHAKPAIISGDFLTRPGRRGGGSSRTSAP